MTTPTKDPSLAPPFSPELEGTVFDRHVLEHQFQDLEQQHDVAALGMWVFLATEVLFFGVLFLGVSVNRYRFPESFEKASEKLNVTIGAINTVVLLVSSLMMVLAVHFAQLGQRRRVVLFLLLTAGLGLLFLVFKAYEYYTDYRDFLIPGWRFRPEEWTGSGVNPYQVELFLMFYWIMTGLHALHVTIGIIAVLVIAGLAGKGKFSSAYYSPVDVTGLYWHFVDLVWIFLFPMLYLLGTHTWEDIHF
jgi:cytochrome c oxidase subunit III